MEIEPERMDPKGRSASAPFQGPKKWQLILFGGAVLVIGVALLFFMFWAALFFMALGLITLTVNRIIYWLRGKKPPKGSQGSIRIYVNRK